MSKKNNKISEFSRFHNLLDSFESRKILKEENYNVLFYSLKSLSAGKKNYIFEKDYHSVSILKKLNTVVKTFKSVDNKIKFLDEEELRDIINHIETILDICAEINNINKEKTGGTIETSHSRVSK